MSRVLLVIEDQEGDGEQVQFSLQPDSDELLAKPEEELTPAEQIALGLFFGIAESSASLVEEEGEGLTNEEG